MPLRTWLPSLLLPSLLLPSLLTACDGPADAGSDQDPGADALMPFVQPTLECRDPLPGEPPGRSEDGRVCTWQSLSGATEEGRHFDDYADCDVVLTHRPYFPVPLNDSEPAPDPRLDDPAYVVEATWVHDQIEATGCTCCHSASAPNGASSWDIDAPGNWVNTFHDSGLAQVAGWVDISVFGAYPPEANNGFDRRYGIPTTDPERMRAFFEGELAHRGRTFEEFADVPPAGGPLYQQLVYEPTACTQGERVDRDGRIHWSGGPARYVHVLRAGSDNPIVPPNLDLPEGTLWRIDVPWDGEPVATATVRYGQTPMGLTQRFPATGAPEALVPGEEYYLYVAQDVFRPLTRCLFTH